MLDRAGQIADTKHKGKSTAEIARIFGVSGRTVQRALAIARERNDLELQLNHKVALTSR
jgi:DNA-binding CsgD family transcriptional regulator